MIHRYRFISEHHATYGVARLCRVLAVQRRQGYYEWPPGRAGIGGVPPGSGALEQ
jgi:hypothetical protein